MSDEKKTPGDENPQDKDPYNFFKFAGPENNDDDNKDKKDGKKRFPFWGVMLIILALLALADVLFLGKPDGLIDYSEFKNKIESGEIVSVEIGETYFIGYGPAEISAVSPSQKGITLFNSSMQKNRTVYRTVGILMSNFIELLDEKGVDYKFVAKSNNYLLQLLMNLIVPFGLLFLIYFILFRRMGGGSGGGMGSLFGTGGSRTKAVEEGKVKTRFADVAGVDEAKEELVEVVDFLKQPKKYTDIGGKIPKGVLLVGPPGTGKTLLARAVAGEAGVPFFRISGSDFVEMFVGVGASRVRDLFRQAREKAPCIIFIDELDAIGKSRMNNLGGNDEREQTLNQLLVEMDGFDNEKGLIILAATNRPDILDPALLRPGRFDRQVVVDRPDVKGREAILRIHAKNVKLDSDVDFGAVAHASAGFSGADLANIVNEAALLAVRCGRKKVTMADFNEAIEKVMVGLQKKSRVVREDERRIVAYHETGHALAAAFTPTADPVHKITIIPRGMGALGYTMQLPEDDTFLSSEKKLLGDVDVMLGGRAAEQIIFNEISTGAANDIQRATDTVRKMITDYGMSTRFKNMTLGKAGKGYGSDSPELVREYAETTQQYIDEEIARIINERYNHVLEMLGAHKDLLEYIAKRLLEIETMEGKEFEDIIKGERHCLELADATAKDSSAQEETSPAEEQD
ncbi:MAG: ATP-dependent zinc metalloprotease FtsH [Treponema porcinum]|uniref:ATP-dependent zinc metalloprotease FtsH n=1 Tax=Treponema porcinum TaxID=261392 RepID=UPI002A82A9DE|nr:ATP-dependent zinc metalloprotease FtsH [Treponema porcinum]MDY5047476.1 ATP-dependent zinc metalloprotease FtsH [Treponema porcinum]